MARLAFDSPGSLLFSLGWYIFLIIIWWATWHYRFSEETNADEYRRFPSFWSWWLTDDHDFFPGWHICNWIVLLCGLYSFLRINITLIYGFYTP